MNARSLGLMGMIVAAPSSDTPGGAVPSPRPRRRQKSFAAALLVLVWGAELPAAAATFTVDTTVNSSDASPGDGDCADSTGACSLRAAIGEANALPNGAEPDRIHFAIPGPGPHTVIAPGGLAVTDPVVIDGYTQPGASPNTDPLATDAVLQVEMRGGIGLEGGLRLETDDSKVRGLAVFSFFANVHVMGDRNVVEGCFLGTDAAGLAALGGSIGVLVDRSADNLIGGETPASRNLISGNNVTGVSLFQTGAIRNRVWGNLIGTDRTGMAPLPNGEETLLVEFRSGAVDLTLVGPEAPPGIRLPAFNEIGGPGPGRRNVISGNAAFGVRMVVSDGNLVENNWIGLAVDGSPLPNGLSGVFFEQGSSYNSVLGNTIAHNAEAGILAGNAIGNRFSGNSIHLNGSLGIDLSEVRCPFRQICPDGVTENDPFDADEGTNRRQNFPVLLSAVAGSGGIEIRGELDSTRGADFEIELFVNDECDPSGHGEAQSSLGRTVVHTDEATGLAEFGVLAPVASAPGQQITATATDDDGNTSELSACVGINAPPVARCRNVTVAADERCLGLASVDNGSFDPDGDRVDISEEPAGPHPLGDTEVTLRAADPGGAEDTCTGIVTVRDETAPTLECPMDRTLPATSPGGAVVDFEPVAADNCTTPPDLSCHPPSDSVFPVGDTVTTCTAADAAMNSVSCSFLVHVQGAAEQIADLIGGLGGVGLNAGQRNSLEVKLHQALEAIAAGDTASACRRLQVFVLEVDSLVTEGVLGTPEGSALIGEAMRIRDVLGCG